MTTYEVRVTQTHVDYYRIDADTAEAAKNMIHKRITTDKVTYGRKVDTIKRTPEVDYAVKVDNKGEVTYQ